MTLLIGYVMIDKIINTVLDVLGITRTEFNGVSKDAHIIDARFISMSLCKKYTKSTLEQIGFRCGDKGHANVLNGLEQASNWYDNNREFREKYDRCDHSVLRVLKQFNTEI